MSASKRRVAFRKWAPHVAAAIVLGSLIVWDQQAFAAVTGFRSPFLTWLTDRVSQLRGATFPSAVALLLVAIGLSLKRSAIWRAGIAVLLTVVLTGAVTTVLKVVIARPGPTPNRVLRTPKSLFDDRFGRFPSSHSAVMFGSAGAVAAFLPAAAVPAFTLAVLVCHERIYRGTHFPSDIFAGMWIGLVTAQLVIAPLSRRKGWREDLVRARVDRKSSDLSSLESTEEPPKVAGREPVA